MKTATAAAAAVAAAFGRARTGDRKSGEDLPLSLSLAVSCTQLLRGLKGTKRPKAKGERAFPGRASSESEPGPRKWGPLGHEIRLLCPHGVLII